MNRQELLELLKQIEISYPFFQNSEEIEQVWFKVMHNFDYKDVKRNLEIAMGEERFQKEPPKAYYLIQGLTPISEKVNFENRIIFCQICKRPLNQKEEQKHVDRCRSIRYLVKQYKKWTGKDLDKRSLWEMSEEEFEEKYNKLLHYIHDHTTDEHEKIRIEYVFEPPSQEIAKKFLGGKYGN